jgi:hypothetical protein
MENLETFIPEIVQLGSEWIEDRDGRVAGWIAFLGLLIGLPASAILTALCVALLSG